MRLSQSDELKAPLVSHVCIRLHELIYDTVDYNIEQRCVADEYEQDAYGNTFNSYNAR